MRARNLRRIKFPVLLALVLATTLLRAAGAAAPEKVIHNFGLGAANQPWASLIADADGNLYGTAVGFACPPFCGAVFELSPQGSGFRYTTLHVFKSRNGDGTNPYGGLLLDSAGNLFGTTRFGAVRMMAWCLSCHLRQLVGPIRCFTTSPGHPSEIRTLRAV